MFTYRISDGEFAQNGQFEGTGYSGAGLTFAEGRNNAAMISIQDKGPIPPGKYRIETPRDSQTLGPCVFNLTPLQDTNTFGRSLFRIHGNNKFNDASEGCIILGPSIRYALAKLIQYPVSNDDSFDMLEVVE